MQHSLSIAEEFCVNASNVLIGLAKDSIQFVFTSDFCFGGKGKTCVSFISCLEQILLFVYLLLKQIPLIYL